MFDFLKKLFGIKSKQHDPIPRKNPVVQTPPPAPTQKPIVPSKPQPAPKQYELKIQTVEPITNAQRQSVSVPAVSKAPVQQTTPSTAPLNVAPKVTAPSQAKPPLPPVAESISPKPVQNGTASGTTRPAVAPRVQRHTVKPPERRVQKSSVYIGLDFGTTFTKAAYEISPSNVHAKYSIKFGQGNSKEAYYLPSVLYFDKSTAQLHIFNDTGTLEEIRYFKYNMISDALQKNKVINAASFGTRIAKEQLCCVFFLSYVIHLIQTAVKSNSGNAVVNGDTSWYIKYGCAPGSPQGRQTRFTL